MAVIAQEVTDRYAAYHADCMEVLPDLPAESVGFSIYSPPFHELYCYSNDPRDLSNCVSYEEFLGQYAYTVAEIYRLTKPGRLTAVHCMDLKKGTYFHEDFPADVGRLHKAAGWKFFRRITIWKDPWLIARRTRMRPLRHKQIVDDSALAGPCGPDYVMVYAKPGKNKEPIRHPRGFSHYPGSTEIPEDLVQQYADFTGDQKLNRLSHWIWRRIASPVWMDIRSGRLLPFADSKENDEEQHVCPLQLDVIERCLELWSNLGDIIGTPYMGVGSEVCMAVAMGRKGVGTELKESYFRQALANIHEACKDNPQQSELFRGKAAPVVDIDPDAMDDDAPHD